jgi:molecular chaperone DnaK
VTGHEAFGIDFGTTNSVLARATATGVETVPLETTIPLEWAERGFDAVLPSVIGFEKDRPTFGWAAKKRDRDRLEAVKRMFATDDMVTIGSNELKVEEAAAMLFRHMIKRAAESGIVGRLDRAVVTIPANSRGLARYRTKLSAGLAGIEVTALINEPTAAAMAHARMIARNQRILVFDWGGGTLDVTVLQAYDGTFIEQASKGIQRLGGIDVDAAFYAAVAARIPGSAEWTEHQRAAFRLDLELAKIQLSAQLTAHIPTPAGSYVDVTRSQFEEAVWPLIERTRGPVDTCLRESPSRIDHLVMVGGSSKMPGVRRFISEIVGVEPSEGVDPMTAVAVGAATAAGILQGTIDDLDFHVGTEHALGTIVHNPGSPKDGEFSVLISRNTKYPCRATSRYLPTKDFQEIVSIEVIEGDPEKPIKDEDNVVLKDWPITLPGRRLKDDAAFDITYEYDLDGILHVLVRDDGTGAVLMEEELAFGAAEDRSTLPGMRRRIDGLMAEAAATTEDASSTLSPRVAAVLAKARNKVIPLVPDADRARLEELAARLEAAPAAEEEERLEALERELRHHTYLLY